MLDLFVYSRLNFKACANALVLRHTCRFVSRKVCRLILLKDGLFWLFGSARRANAKCTARFNNCCNKLLVCCTRDFAKTLVFCALLPLGINCAAQYYNRSYCSGNFGLLKFETSECLNPLVRMQISDVSNVCWLHSILKFVILSKRLRLTSFVCLLGRVPERAPTPFVFYKLERASAVLLS
ncbi:hypothetical protein TETLON2a_000056 [Candidatus Hodgkinia cicadicola]|nr:hypothetical protein TETLON2a_000056 [Candidatus Hodgkinia cicadicola]